MTLLRNLIFILLILNTLLTAQEEKSQYEGIANQLSLTFSDLIWKYEPELIKQNLKSSIVNHQLFAIVLYDKGLKEYQAAWKSKDTILYKKSDDLIKIPGKEFSEKIIKKMKKDQQELGELIIYYKKHTSKEITFTDKEKAYIKSHPTLKVSNEQKWAPFNFNENGKAKGFSIDYFELIAKKAGFHIHYIIGPTWKEFTDMLKEKKLDVLLNVAYNKERTRWMEFTKNKYFQVHYGLAVNSTNSKIHEFKDILDKTVAIEKGFWMNKWLEKNHPEVKVKTYPNTLEALRAISLNEADAYLGNISVAGYLLKNYWITNVEVKHLGKTKLKKTNDLYIGVQKDNFILKNIIDKAMNVISDGEINQLQLKWFGNIQNKEQPELDLTREEIKYLKNKGSLKMCVDPNWLPFERIDEQGKYKGIGSDVIKIVSNKINTPIDLVSTTSWPETIQNFLNKQCDILPVASSTPNRQKIMNFTRPYIKKSLVIATKEDQFFIQDSSELKGKKIGLVEGYAFIELLKQKHPDINIVTVKNIKEGLKEVERGELFGFVDALPSIGYIIQKEGMLDLKIAGRLEFDVELGIASQNDEPLLNSIMQKALDDIPKEQIDSIIGKWISIKIEQAFDYKTLIYIIIVFSIIVAILMFRQYYIKKMNKKLEKISITDALTNIYNRRHFNEMFPKIINSAKRDNELVSFLIMDIDHFKQYNDTYGHQMGDDVLTKVATAIKNSLHRADDYCFRLGGEEFGVIFKVDSKEKAFEFANTIRKSIENLLIEHSGNSASSYVTASMGLVCKNANDISSVDEIYKQGDDLLYKAKEGGRNQVVI